MRVCFNLLYVLQISAFVLGLAFGTYLRLLLYWSLEDHTANGVRLPLPRSEALCIAWRDISNPRL